MKSCVYQITCNITGDVYIGSTVDMTNRLSSHKNIQHNTCSSVPIIERGNFTTIILEEWIEIDCLDLRKKEQEYLLKHNCVNIRNAYTNQVEYNKKYNFVYYHKHKDEKRKTKKIENKEYYVKNKDKLLQKIKCYCGSEYVYAGKARHQKTSKHLNFIQI